MSKPQPHSVSIDLGIIQGCISEFSTRDQSVPWVTDAQAALRRLEEQLEVYRKFYEAWWIVEQGVTNLDLHAEAVTRLSEAHAAVIRLDFNPAMGPTNEQIIRGSHDG